jgi:hypothetical protein
VPTIEKRQEKHAKKIKTSFVLLTLLFFLVLGGFAWMLVDIRDVSTRTATLSLQTAKLTAKTAHLTRENTKRIAEIQASRNYSCRQTYRGVRQVFRPFFVGAPEAQIKKFNRTIDTLIAGCQTQVKPKSKPKGQ